MHGVNPYVEESATKPGTRSLRLLCVDDSEDDQLLFRRAWESAGLPVAWRVAGTALEAIEYLRQLIEESKARAVAWPGLIVVDVTLPSVDGFEVVKFVRGTLEINHIPVVLWTGCLSSDNRAESARVGADLCVEKPCSFEEIVDTVRRLYRLAVELGGRNS